MTRTEREHLTRLINRRAKLAREDIDSRQAHLIAEVEAQLAARYKSSHELWAHITKRAADTVKTADDEIAALCHEHGIPEDFRPSINLGWFGRGENADAGRRAELRAVAKTRIAASARTAKLEIERSALNLHTQLVQAHSNPLNHRRS